MASTVAICLSVASMAINAFTIVQILRTGRSINRMNAATRRIEAANAELSRIHAARTAQLAAPRRINNRRAV